MSKIHVLDQNTINQIAAGEVVDRPASIVKEMLENSIDAGATAITVEIKNGGLELIRITDNGSGIEYDDIRNAFAAHATSKIKDAADLVSIGSLGFRGEALSSIAAVCRVELITKTRMNLTGYCMKIEGGEEISLEEIGAPDGTTFIVRDIFYNTPARRKFLKTGQTEGMYITELVSRISMSRPDISFRLIVNGQNKLATTGNGKLKDVIYTIYGREVATNLIPVKLKLSGLSMTGFVGKPVINRASRSIENYFVNGRYIKSKVICKAIEDAYKPYMMQHKYPFTVLIIEIPSELLDVNVHPAKMELRFRQEDVLYAELFKALSDTISGKEYIVQVDLNEAVRKDEKEKQKTNYAYPSPGKTYQSVAEPVVSYGSTIKIPEPFETHRMDVSPITKQEHTEDFSECKAQKPKDVEEKPGIQTSDIILCENQQPVKEERTAEVNQQDINEEKTAEVRLQDHKEEKVTAVNQLELFDDRLLSKRARSRHKLIGQLFDTYWLIEYEDKLYIIDQHAAHEKVLYERTMKLMKENAVTSQMISPSIMLHLTEHQRMTLEKNIDYLRRLGFEIDDFGGSTYAVSGIPANLLSLNQVDLLLEIIDDLSEEGGHSSNQSILDRVATMSCKAAVKGNTRLTRDEADTLIDELLTLDNPYACPHGRPTIISMSKTEIEKKFKRIV